MFSFECNISLGLVSGRILVIGDILKYGYFPCIWPSRSGPSKVIRRTQIFLLDWFALASVSLILINLSDVTY